MIVGNKTPPSGVVCLVVVTRVFWQHWDGDSSPAPRYVIPGRGSQPPNELGESSIPAPGTPLGVTLRVSRWPRNRMGLRGSERQHARHQFERNVYRSARYFVDRGWLHRASAPSSTRQTRLSGQARRTRPGHGRFRRSWRIRKPETLQRPSFIPHSSRRLRRLILDWTPYREASRVHFGWAFSCERVAWGSFDSHHRAK